MYQISGPVCKSTWRYHPSYSAWGGGSLAEPDPTFFLHAEGKVGSGQLMLSRLFRFPKIIGGVSGSAI